MMFKKFLKYSLVSIGALAILGLSAIVTIGVLANLQNGDIQIPQTSNFTDTNVVPDSGQVVESDMYDSYERLDDYEVERSFADYGDMDCSDFSSQSEAQDFFESEGGPADDYHNLDRDGDGSVCETL